jgi:Domain of unknown function (DUF4279)
MYNDNYETCSKTYVTLRIYCDLFQPDKLTEYLGILPSETQIKGQESKQLTNKLIEKNGWFLTTENIIKSKNRRRHIDYLADKLLPIKSKLKSLIADGSEVDISCFWESESGQGGPTVATTIVKTCGTWY